MVRNYIPKGSAGRGGRKAQVRPSVAANPCKRCGGPITSPGPMSSLKGIVFCGKTCAYQWRFAHPEGQKHYTCKTCKTPKTRLHFATSIATRQRMMQCNECAQQRMVTRRFGPKRYRFLIHQAKQRGIAVALTVRQWLSYTGLPCYWCKTPLTHPRLDRIDSDGPYSLGNCVQACFLCNRARGSAPRGAWLAHVRAIAKAHPSGPAEPYVATNYNKRRKRAPPPPTR